MGNEEESDPAGSSDQSEPAAEVSVEGDNDDGEDASGDASTNTVDVETSAGGRTLRRRHSKPTNPPTLVCSGSSHP